MSFLINQKKYKIAFVAVLSMFLFISCSKDFLNKEPTDAIDAGSFFKTAGQLQVFVNGFYSRLAPQYVVHTAPSGGAANNIGLDNNTDVLIHQTTVTGSLNRWTSSSVPAETNATWNNGFSAIRDDNYFLHYANLNAENTRSAQHYIGEGYFFRAWDYFKLLQVFGGVPVVTSLLTEVDESELYKERSSRYDVAKQILSDLDMAIERLHWKNEAEGAISGRITKEAALQLKVRVALYEGTWEYYHQRKATPFAMEGKDGLEFIQQVEPTAKILIERHGANIFTMGGDKDMAYNQLFAQKDATAVEGAFLYKVYDAAKLAFSHNFFFKILDKGPSITDHLVDMYLTKDGKQQNGTKLLNDLGQTLDPRFRQTIWTPDRGPQNQLPGRGGDGFPFRYPLIANQAPYTENFTSTGYRNFKGAVFAQEALKGETDDILMRYEEVLLSLAEAKAILGTLTQNDLDKTVNIIRERVGMIPMTINAGAGFSYRKDLGFDLSESAIVNEIRRERNVEFALEGFRLNDLKRWAVYEDVINGYQPKGALLQEFVNYYMKSPEQALLDEGNDPALYSQIRKDGYLKNEFGLVENGTAGSVASFADGRINPWFKVVEFRPGGRGLFIEPKRDYLDAVPLHEIKLYESKGVKLSQNPGWN